MNRKTEYQNLCKKEKGICVYSQPWWLDAVCGDDWDVLLQYNEEEIYAAMVYYKKKRWGLNYITQPVFTQHNGPWIKIQEGISEYKKIAKEKKIISKFIDDLEKNKEICYIQQSLDITTTNWLPYYWKGYKQTTGYTYRLNDISDTDYVFTNMHPNKRNSIKKAAKSKLRFCLDLDSKTFYNFHRETLKELGKEITYSFDIFERMYNASYDNKQGRTFYVTNENGKLISALFCIWDDDCAYHLITAISGEGRKVSALDYCVWNALLFFSEQGIRAYDFEGSMMEKVEESYRKFGTTQTQYFKINKINSKNPLIKWAIKKKLR